MSKPLITYMVLAFDGLRRPPMIVETQVGHALSDVIQELWDNKYGPVERVLAWDIDEGRSEDVTRFVAQTLAARTFAEGETPESVWRFCEPRSYDVFDEDRDAAMLVSPNAEHRLGRRELGLGAR